MWTLNAAWANADSSQRSTIRQLMDQLETEGQAQVQAAATLYQEKKFEQAIKAYSIVSRVFMQLPSGVAAREALKKIESDGEAQGAIQEAKAALLDDRVQEMLDGLPDPPSEGDKSDAPRTATTLPAEASSPEDAPKTAAQRVAQIKQCPPEMQLKVLAALENIVKTFPASPTGARATETIKLLKDDPEFRQRLEATTQNAQMSNAFNRAESYRKAGMTDKAREYYRQFIKAYPNSDQAAKAKLALAELDKLAEKEKAKSKRKVQSAGG